MNATLTSDRQDPRTLTVNDLIGSFPNLPAAFQILPRLMTLLDDPNADCTDLADVIRIDPSLTAAVFRVANSARYIGRGATHSLSQAIVRLGLREVYRVVLEIATVPSLNGPNPSAFGPVDLWRHSLATAVASQVLAEHLTQQDPEVVFSAALLHDIGKTVLVRAARKQYVNLLKNCADTNRSVKFAEWESFGIDHAQIGGYLLRVWKFPERIAAVVAGHHSPEAAGADYQTPAALVAVGNVIAYRLGFGNGAPPYVTQLDRDTLKMIGLAAEQIGDFDNEIRDRLQTEQARL